MSFILLRVASLNSLRPFFSRVLSIASHDAWNEVAVACNTRHIRGYHENEKVVLGYAKTLTFRYTERERSRRLFRARRVKRQSGPDGFTREPQIIETRSIFVSRDREIATLKVLRRKLREIIGTSRYVGIISFVRKYAYLSLDNVSLMKNDRLKNKINLGSYGVVQFPGTRSIDHKAAKALPSPPLAP